MLDYLAQNEMPADAADLLRRGTRILVDKDGLVAKIRERPLPKLENLPPSESDFGNVVHDFWYHALWTAKHLRRGELWWAKGGCDIHLKELLRRMLQWHAIARHGPGFDTWMRGRFLEEWADPRAIAALPHVFAHYDAEDIARALGATMDLFRWLAVETAAAFGYSYPTEREKAVVERVDALLVGGKRNLER
jgi:aminoglycoside 6-adenylyltransferase